MAKKDKKDDAPVIPKTQMLRLRKLFSMQSGKDASAVNPNRLN